jgi:tRNA pseudouridine32 synthase/23S rRNA pseudouridine746 synthase
MNDFECLHRDTALIVALKPAGLLSVPGRHEPDCLARRVQAAFADALVVHRLDQATSGLLLFARGAAVQRVLGAAFAERRIGKRYVAVVEGEMAADRGEIDAPLAADWPQRPRQQVDALHGKPSLTRWRVLERVAGRTRVELEPVSGRSHQLRVHLLHIGHPICGDELYGRGLASAPRLLLHATQVTLTHPELGTPWRFDSAAPFPTAATVAPIAASGPP